MPTAHRQGWLQRARAAGSSDEAGEANAEASAWVSALFNELVLDLDGCALSFRRLQLQQLGGGWRRARGGGGPAEGTEQLKSKQRDSQQHS